jgi:hypothetical protein
MERGTRGVFVKTTSKAETNCSTFATVKPFEQVVTHLVRIR